MSCEARTPLSSPPLHSLLSPPSLFFSRGLVFILATTERRRMPTGASEGYEARRSEQVHYRLTRNLISARCHRPRVGKQRLPRRFPSPLPPLAPPLPPSYLIRVRRNDIFVFSNVNEMSFPPRNAFNGNLLCSFRYFFFFFRDNPSRFRENVITGRKTNNPSRRTRLTIKKKNL